jgi:cell division protein ZapE
VQVLRAGFDLAVTAALGSVLNDEQEPVADRLALLGAQLDSSGRRRWGRRHGFGRRVPSGVYLHGPVGRGKTWLVDVLLHQLPADGVL